jgi:hypothetical protein
MSTCKEIINPSIHHLGSSTCSPFSISMVFKMEYNCDDPIDDDDDDGDDRMILAVSRKPL